MMTSLDGMVFGMPPGTHVSDAVLKASMPTASITPCEPEFSRGLSLFTLNESKGKTKYDEILHNVGFSLSGKSVNVAYLADNFPTDTFNNEYGETFLDKFSQVASSGLGDLAQIAGWTDYKVAKDQATNLMNAMPGGKVASDYLAKLMNKTDTTMNNNLTEKNRSMYDSMKSAMQGIVTGARVDFPQVWKNSSFTPSYSMTIRLYNPNPGSEKDTRKYIVGPIAALVALGIPKVSEDSSMYKWPLLCKVRSPGIYNLNAAYINSIAVIKGGDQQSIAYNQNLAMCDVRIDFGSLYSSILSGAGSKKYRDSRPTLAAYLEGIGGDGLNKNKGRGQVNYVSKGPEVPSKAPNEFLMKKNNATSKIASSTDTPTSRSAEASYDNLGWGITA
jgi:hypothetical protein